MHPSPYLRQPQDGGAPGSLGRLGQLQRYAAFHTFLLLGWNGAGVEHERSAHTAQGLIYGLRGVLALRGLRYQIQHPEGKLLLLVQGNVFDVAVGLRQPSATFAQWIGQIPTAANYTQLWIPPGFADCIMLSGKTVEALYKTTYYWFPDYERSVLLDAWVVAIKWPTDYEPQLVERDLTRRARAASQNLE